MIKRVIIPQSTDRYLLLCVHTYDMCWSLSFSGSTCTRLHSPTPFLLRAYIKIIYDRNNWSQDIKYSILVLLLTWRFSVNLLCGVASEREREKQDRFSLIWYNKPFASVQKHHMRYLFEGDFRLSIPKNFSRAEIFQSLGAYCISCCALLMHTHGMTGNPRSGTDDHLPLICCGRVSITRLFGRQIVSTSDNYSNDSEQAAAVVS